MSDRITPDSFFSDTHAFHGVGGTTTVRLSSLVFSFRLLKFFRSAKNRERSEGKRKNNFHFGPSVVTQLFGELFFFSSSNYIPQTTTKENRRRFAPRVAEFCFDMHVLLTKVSFCLFSTTTVATTADVYEPAGADGSRRERRRRRKRFRR
jgi:hypothetical protein